MNQRPPRLLIPQDHPRLDADQLAYLRSRFEVVTGNEARAMLKGNGAANDMVVLPGSDPGKVQASTTPDGRLSEADLVLAAQSLLDFTAESIEKMNSVERLKWLETAVTRTIRDAVGFDQFEVRLLNRKTLQLELVIAVGIKPLPVGETLYAKEESNGISGYVAVTRRSYLCRDTRGDPRYRAGLENAASSVTVPLLLHGDTVGVLNIESTRPDAFTQRDLARAEAVATYIAIALHMLNLLVVERFTTRKSTCQMLSEEIVAPLDDITKSVLAFRTTHDLDGAGREALDRIVQNVEKARNAVSACNAGPQSLLGLERTLRECRTNPHLEGKSVLVVDDDASIRDTIAAVLSRMGCDVISCENGQTALSSMRVLGERAGHLDVVISDVKLPDLNGYEVFRSARDRYPNIPIILMTGFGYDPHHSIVRASQEGLQSILFKPFKADQLVEEVTRAITSK